MDAYLGAHSNILFLSSGANISSVVERAQLFEQEEDDDKERGIFMTDYVTVLSSSSSLYFYDDHDIKSYLQVPSS